MSGKLALFHVLQYLNNLSKSFCRTYCITFFHVIQEIRAIVMACDSIVMSGKLKKILEVRLFLRLISRYEILKSIIWLLWFDTDHFVHYISKQPNEYISC